MLWRALRLAMVVGVLVPASAWAGVKATPIGTFNAPTYIAAPSGDTQRLFVVQQSGQIELVEGGKTTQFLDISSKVMFSGEQGLLSMAFAPDYATSHRFYVYYTSTNCPNPPGCDEHVSEFTADPSGDTASPTEHLLITIPHPSQNNHNGGQLQFGPDGDLYISVGDGGGGDDTELNAQHTDRLLGKLLRISPGATSYTIPAGNPFSSSPECPTGSNGGSNCAEIWAYGLRNPWRFSFDSVTGDLIIGDVGQGRDEEIDFAHPGQKPPANYGWPCYEGSELNANRPAAECSPLPAPEAVIAPVLSYPHPGNCAGQPFCGDGIIGGYVMHDPTLPSLNGCYVFGDLSNPDLQVVGLRQPMAVGQVALGPQVSHLSSFGVDASGHLYAADIGSGTVYRLDSDGVAATDPTCPTVIVPVHPPVNTAPPQIAGPPIPGARLTCVPGTWTGASSFAYQWLRDGADRAAGVTYRPSVADVGHTLACVVTASNADGSTQADSVPVRIIRDAPPLLFALRISPSAFRPARSGQTIVRAGRRGATLSFRLDEPATVTLTVQRAVHGSRINGRCRVAAHTAARPCTVWKAVKGSVRVQGKRGLNRLHFSGRINHHALVAGGYRLVLRARDQAGRASNPVRVRFSISR